MAPRPWAQASERYGVCVRTPLRLVGWLEPALHESESGARNYASAYEPGLPSGYVVPEPGRVVKFLNRLQSRCLRLASSCLLAGLENNYSGPVSEVCFSARAQADPRLHGDLRPARVLQ